MSRFKQFLGPEDRAVFDDLLSQCKLYAAEAGLLASPVKEVPLLLSMIFAHHKMTHRTRKTPQWSPEVIQRIAASFVWVSLCGVGSPLAHMNGTCGMGGPWHLSVRIRRIRWRS
jgi:hypothetical protein